MQQHIINVTATKLWKPARLKYSFRCYSDWMCVHWMQMNS